MTVHVIRANFVVSERYLHKGIIFLLKTITSQVVPCVLFNSNHNIVDP